MHDYNYERYKLESSQQELGSLAYDLHKNGRSRPANDNAKESSAKTPTALGGSHHKVNRQHTALDPDDGPSRKSGGKRPENHNEWCPFDADRNKRFSKSVGFKFANARRASTAYQNQESPGTPNGLKNASLYEIICRHQDFFNINNIVYTNKKREREKNNSEYLAEHDQMRSIFGQDDHNSGTPTSRRHQRGPITPGPDRLLIKGLSSGSRVGTQGQTPKTTSNIQRARLDSDEANFTRKDEKLGNFSSPFVGKRLMGQQSEGVGSDRGWSADRHRQTIKTHSLLSKIFVENRLAGNRGEA
jgi:hypothetical protein